MKKIVVSVLFVFLIFICHRLCVRTTLNEPSYIYEDEHYTYENRITYNKHVIKTPKGAHSLTRADNYHKLELPLKVVGLILARGGSKGIPKKNLAKVGNLTLLGRSLKSINEFGCFSSVWVSTDDKEIAEEAKRWGAQVHWRSPESATDTASSMLGVEDFLTRHGDVDVIALIQCTSPFLSPLFLMRAHLMVVNEKYDTVFAATRSHKLRWQRDIGSVYLSVIVHQKEPISYGTSVGHNKRLKDLVSISLSSQITILNEIEVRTSANTDSCPHH